MIIMMLLMVGVLFWMQYSQQRKIKKEKENLDNSLKKGTKILTSGGIYGTIVEIAEKRDTLLVEVAQGVRIRVSIGAVVSKVEEPKGNKAEESKTAANAEQK